MAANIRIEVSRRDVAIARLLEADRAIYHGCGCADYSSSDGNGDGFGYDGGDGDGDGFGYDGGDGDGDGFGDGDGDGFGDGRLRR